MSFVKIVISQLKIALPLLYLSENPGVGPHGDLHDGGGAGGDEDEQVRHGEVQQEQVGAAAEELEGEQEESPEVGQGPNISTTNILGYIKRSIGRGL